LGFLRRATSPYGAAAPQSGDCIRQLSVVIAEELDVSQAGRHHPMRFRKSQFQGLGNSNSSHQNNLRPIEILDLGFVSDLVSWDLGFLT
jgi:hypothetical protein